MKYVINIKLLLIAALVVSVFGCKRSSNSSNADSATGWAINNRQGGFQYNTQFEDQDTPPGTSFIEGGTFTMGKVQDDPMHDWNNAPSQQHVQSFYMDENEVTNLNYLYYLDYLKSIYPPNDPNYANIYVGALPDTLVWRNRLGYMEMMTENYLRHPSYANYPVVGVSWIQALEYTNWRTDRVAELALQKAGYLKRDSQYTDLSATSTFSTDTYINAPNQTYGGDPAVLTSGRRQSQVDANGDPINIYAKMESGVIGPKFRLPTEVEWEYAALGMGELRSYNLYRGRKKYPWDGQYSRSGKRAKKGDQLANFKQSSGDYGGIAGWSDDGADITQEVKYYEPNDFGLYDMAGNVAEWVADVYRPIIDDEFNDFNYFRGNTYYKNAINDDGSVKIVQETVYETLSNGKIVARNLPGEIEKIPIDANETYLRTNFDRSDNRNFRDGDKKSSRQYSENFENGDSKNRETGKMYNSPNHSLERDSITGELTKEYDQSDRRTSLINDEVRVIKGGSWKDRSYWLDPAQRRYFPQDMATDYIGFRCAVSRLGSKALSSKKTRN
jgi:gliding motility-associated lipoprotein GldJ